MPIYPDLNLIFVHVPKTAGSAIVAALADHALPRPSGNWRRLTSHLPFAEPMDKLWLRRHLSARWMKVKLGAQVWDRFRSFAVVRDPYDRAVSSYEFARQRPKLRRHKAAMRRSFTEFLRAEPDDRMQQAPLLTDRHGALMVQKVLRHETLAADLAAMCQAWDLVITLPAQPVNATTRAPTDSYLTDEAVAIINRRAGRDFDQFGYARR